MSEKKEDESPSEEAPSQAESFDASKSGTSETYDMKDFCPGIRIEAKDFDGKWYPAKVSDVDWTENEILVHFENWNTKFDEWIPMDSSRLRPIQKPVLQQKEVVKFSKGEEVMAVWSANQKYPGIIQAVLTNDRYDVLFSDGFLKRLKGHKISKLQGGGVIKPEVKTFTDIGTKEERRERKRKINVAELFHINKRSKKKGLVSSKPQDIKTYPVSKSRTKSSLVKKVEALEEQTESTPTSETKEVKQTEEKPPGPVGAVANKSSAENIPAAFEVKYLNGQTEIWSKQLYQRSEGRTAGKLDIVILNPQGRKFRSRNEIMKYCEENGIIYSHEAFDFSAKGRPKSKPIVQTPTVKSEISVEDKEKPLIKKAGRKSQGDILLATPIPPGVPPQAEILPQENFTPNKVFIGDYEVVIENGKFICPVKVCGKHFRRENLLHMHMKHYHPEFSKYLDYTPSVTDLAYARTVGNLDAVESPSAAPRKVSGADKLEKTAVKVETFRRTSDVSAESGRDAKKLKTSDNKVESKTHSVKTSPDSSSAVLASTEEPTEEKNKTSSVGLQLGRNSSNLNETEAEFPENAGNLPDGVSGEQTPRDGESSNVTPSIVKPYRYARLHNRKKSSRFQGSFSDHIRKRRFLSQDRPRPHNRLGRQQQSQLRGQQFPLTQPLQTAVSPQPSVEDTNSNAPSQGHTMARYLKPHLNISNEISGKNTLLTNSKALSPRLEKSEENSEGIEMGNNTTESSLGARKKTQGCRRSFLAGLLNARKRKGNEIRKRWRRRKRGRIKASFKTLGFDRIPVKEIESGRNEKVEKPDVKSENDNYNCDIVNKILETGENSPHINGNLKLRIRRLTLNDDNFTSEIVKPPTAEPKTEEDESPKENFSKNYVSNEKEADSKGNSTVEEKTSSKELRKAYVLVENIYRKGNFPESKNTPGEGKDENARTIPRNIPSDRQGGKKRKRNAHSCKSNRRRLAKKVRFENSVLEKWIDEGEGIDWSPEKKEEAIGEGDERKSEQKRLHLNEFLSESEMSQQKRSDDSSRDENVIPSKKTLALDQTEAVEDSKSPIVVENDKVEKLRRNEIINCLCGITEEDGLMIQCDICLCWQHGHCAGILRELDVPDKYTCAICKNPYRGRSSMRYLHDQEWLKEGTLPSLSFRSKRNDIIEQRKAILKRSHDLSGSITLLAQVIHSLRIKVNIAEKKDHPKLWLWAKKWTEKKPNRLKEDPEIKEEKSEEQDLNTEVKKEGDSPNDKNLPKAPEPEAPIDSAECRLNLLDHLIHYQSLIDARLSCIESLVAELESMQDDAVNDETPDRYPRTKATVQMILRDLNTMKKIASI